MQDVHNQIEKINLHDPAVRRLIVEQGGLLGFCLVYLRHYFTVEPADFHFVLAKILEDPDEELIEIIGFRGSAKSTFATLATPLFLALEERNHFIIVAGDTTTQTKLNIENIRYELEENELLREDYGSMYSSTSKWAEEKLILSNGVMIMGRSRGQKMRGLRHRQYRPDVVIVDDAEDVEWAEKRKNRNKTERWFDTEVIPAQQEDKSKLIVIGNLVHKDALMMRIKKRVKADGTKLFKCLVFPLIDFKTKKCTWRGKYPTKKALQKQKDKITISAWSREYLLKIVAEEDQVIKETDIHYYENKLLDERDENGNLKHKILDSGKGVDIAISEKQTADFSAIVGGFKITLDEKDKILIQPKPFNKRVGYDGLLKACMSEGATAPYGTKWYVEDVGYQKSALQGMKKKGLSVVAMRPIADKKARLETASPFIKDGTVLFARSGCEELIEQLLDFGSEEHDDLVDALVYLILGMIAKRKLKVVSRTDKV